MASAGLPLTLLLVVATGVTTVSAMDMCVVDCSRYGTALGNLADDPVNCHKYYICFSTTDWSQYSFNCPDGENFDTIIKHCRNASSPFFPCTPPCERCTYDCANHILGKASNKFDCSVYYECGATSETKQCPVSAPYFDGSECQTKKDNCCTCKSSCSISNANAHQLIADYHNCTNYYLCINEGIQDDTTHGHCPNGNFEPMLGACVEGAPCLGYPACNSWSAMKTSP